MEIVGDHGRGVPDQVYGSSHAYTEDTQTNWNGIIGRIELQLDSSVESKYAETKTGAIPSRSVASPSALQMPDFAKDFHIEGAHFYANDHRIFSEDSKYAETQTGANPNRSVASPSALQMPDFAKDFHIEGAHYYANDHRIFLRVKHDAAVWPLTGHVEMGVEGWMKYLGTCKEYGINHLRFHSWDAAVWPLTGHVEMGVEGWMKYLGTCKEYGINHLRFHSWCPQEAAFVAADSLGIYLQPELPFWGSFDKKDERLMAFLHQEGENILREYGHHPSFRMMALGNELWGDILSGVLLIRRMKG